MKKIFGWMMAGAFVLAVSSVQAADTSNAAAAVTPVTKAKVVKTKKKASKDVWVCPMCHITSDKAGKCPMCGMDMVKEKKAKGKTDKKPAMEKSKDMSSGKSQGLDVATYGKGPDAKICPVSEEKIKAGKGEELTLSNGKKIMVCCADCQKDVEKNIPKYASLMY